jgi:hypothetical protein
MLLKMRNQHYDVFLQPQMQSFIRITATGLSILIIQAKHLKHTQCHLEQQFERMKMRVT